MSRKQPMVPKCSVLLIEDSPDSVTLVSHFLGSSKIAEFRLATVPTVAAAHAALGREGFDVILLDLNLPDSRGLDTFARVRDAAGTAPIVILTAVEDESVATAAIGQGAADYLIKGEVGGEGLARRLRFAVERNRAVSSAQAEPAPSGRVLVVIGAKGGAGASTMAINLAAIYSRAGKNVLALELRPNGGSLAAMLNVPTPLTIDALSEFGGAYTLDAGSGKLSFGARLIAAPMGFGAIARWEPQAVDAAIERAAATADIVIVDAAPGSPDLLRAAVARARFNLLVVEREPVSIQLAGRMAATLAGWTTLPNAIGAALVNHLPFMDAAPLPAIRAELKCGVSAVLPPARELLQSYRRQGPIVLAQPGAPVSVGFEELANRIDHDPPQFLL